MVTLKSAQAIGSFLGTGTHVWLEIIDQTGEKTTFSGSKMGKLLGVIKNYKRDYDKAPSRGKIEIPAPAHINGAEWDKMIIKAGDQVIEEMNKVMRFRGPFPYLNLGGNCCTIANAIIEKAGGCIPRSHLKGFTPGLKTQRCC